MLNHRYAAPRSGCAAMISIALAGVFFHSSPAVASDAEPLDQLTIIAPSAAGGGYDLTAQAMKRVLESEKIARTVKITRSPGAGGLLGLAELIAAHSGDSRYLLIGGMVMMGATASNRAAISPLDATPIARLTGEYDVIAVPQASPYRVLDDLLEAIRADPGNVRWVGGSAGSTDELLMRQLARAVGVDPHLMPYTALPGGSEILARLVNGQSAAGISGIVELEALIQKGRLRGLAISSPHRLPGVNIPTFDELGIAGLSVMNWRGVFAAPGISSDDRSRIEDAIGRMTRSAGWQAELERHHWRDAHLGSAAFTEFMLTKGAAWPGPFAGEPLDPRLLPSAMARRFMWAIVPAVAAIALMLALYLQRARSGRREIALRRALQDVSRDAEQRTREMQGMLAGVSSHIEREFGRWSLSAAERTVAHLMLKGLPLKEIAVMRGTSDRTVRQQAQAIYRKAGLDGRSDLAAYFLEEFLAPVELRGSLDGAGLPGFPVNAGAVAPTLKPSA